MIKHQCNYRLNINNMNTTSSILKRVFVVILAIVLIQQVPICAQSRHKFNPEQFERELEKYIVKQAKLTKTETAKFLPIYREMRAKQHVIFEKNQKKGFPNMQNDKECAEAIRTRDVDDIRMKQIQRTYHNKFLKVLPAKKVMDIIHAEDEFHWNAIQHIHKGADKKKNKH